jgi:hypothetical protein
MYKIITGVLLIIAIMFLGNCTKDETEAPIKVPQSTEIRSGIRLKIFHKGSFSTENYLQGATNGFVNTQVAYNKDSIVNVVYDKVSTETVYINNAVYGIYIVSINFVNPNVSIPIERYFVKDSTDHFVLTPIGVNIAKGAKYWIQFERLNTVMNYYDTDLFKYRKKYQYRVTDYNLSYKDYIVGNNNSSVLTLNHY